MQRLGEVRLFQHKQRDRAGAGPGQKGLIADRAHVAVAELRPDDAHKGPERGMLYLDPALILFILEDRARLAHALKLGMAIIVIGALEADRPDSAEGPVELPGDIEPILSGVDKRQFIRFLRVKGHAVDRGKTAVREAQKAPVIDQGSPQIEVFDIVK